jgi:hypothetical protein
MFSYHKLHNPHYKKSKFRFLDNVCHHTDLRKIKSYKPVLFLPSLPLSSLSLSPSLPLTPPPLSTSHSFSLLYPHPLLLLVLESLIEERIEERDKGERITKLFIFLH